MSVPQEAVRSAQRAAKAAIMQFCFGDVGYGTTTTLDSRIRNDKIALSNTVYQTPKSGGNFVEDLRAVAPIQSIREVVYEQLKQAVLSGAFDGGERLVEHDLAKRLHVSRTPVREALKRLESEGLLQALPRQGLVARQYSDEEIREIYMIRIALESLAAECAARNATDEDIAALEVFADEMERVSSDPEASDAMRFEAHRVFSEAFIRASRMPTLVRLIESLREQLSRFRQVSLRGKVRQEMALQEHRKLLDAIRQKNPELAVHRTQIHIEHALEAYFESTDANGGENGLESELA